MDIKSQVKCVIVYAKCQESADVKGDKEAFAYHGQRMRRSLDDIDRWADMAEAAIAFCEYQINNGWDTNVDGTMYIRERGKLWDRFTEARAKAKGANNGSA